MSIECLDYRPVNKNSVLGYFDIRLTKQHLEIYDCVLLQKDGKRWVSMPNKPHTDAQGNKRYLPVVRVYEKDLQRPFMEAIKKAIDEFIEKNAKNYY